MTRMKILAVAAGLLACVLVNEARSGDVYKYVDERGNTMYTDKPIPGAVRVSTGSQRTVEAVRRDNAAAQSADAARLAASNQRVADDQINARAAASVAKDLEASRQERCQKARDEYQRAINTMRLYREKPDGTREYLSDAEIAQTRVNAYKTVEAVCGPQG